MEEDLWALNQRVERDVRVGCARFFRVLPSPQIASGTRRLQRGYCVLPLLPGGCFWRPESTSIEVMMRCDVKAVFMQGT